ncbi:uncharacterized protein LOC129276150 [Lytechinus pictus]|uniref:uncharacterized protein LOC129276150 n=1 Tax=Lytechinus pictus TaxID=7653 RepID=UPI0030BA0D46
MAVPTNTILVIFLLGGVSTVFAQRTCFECVGTYRTDSDEDQNDCFTTNADTRTDDNCNGQCSTSISLRDSSIIIERGCQRDDDLDQCNDCSNKEDCLLCCNSDRCNGDRLLTLLEDKALTQTCYSCRYSEIPGVKSYGSCARGNFEESGTGVETMHCHGMCYSSLSYINGVEDIVRGCAYYGNGCDVQSSDGDCGRNGITERNSVQFRRSCCMGDKCNSALTFTPGLLTMAISTIFAAIFCRGV